METPLAFVTLFLGLVSGEQIVEFEATSSVAAIEVQMDAVVVSRLGAPPWRTTIDFGPELAPRRLRAIARNQGGAEVGRVEQLINVQRSHAEVTLLVERDSGGRPVRAKWLGPEIEITLDGRRLPVDASGSAPLPTLNLEVPHLLSATVRFGRNVAARHDLVLGADVNDETRSELSSTIYRPATKKKQGTEVPRLRARVDGAPVPVVAVDRGQATVFVVRPDRFSDDATRRIKGVQRPRKTLLAIDNVRVDTGDRSFLRYEAMLAAGDVTRFVWPYPTQSPGASRSTSLFESSREVKSSSGGFRWLLGSVTADGFSGPSHFADAVALAGTQAQASGNRTAVVLVLDDSPSDPSQYRPAQVRDYLQRLRIPLFVWSIAPGKPVPLAAGWGPVVDLSRSSGIDRAVRALREDLEAQRVVWIEGTETPDRIEIGDDAG
jgi:hypothetical protein